MSDKMSYEQALAVFGFSKEQPLKVLKYYRNSAYKKAFEDNDERRQKEINIAFEILAKDKPADDEIDLIEQEDSRRFGTVKALCREKRDLAFYFDWIAKTSKQDGIDDEISLSNPQISEWDASTDGYVLIDAKGQRKHHDIGGRYCRGEPFDPHQDIWKSEFKATINFDRESEQCPFCKAPNFKWCDYCDAIFCHHNREHYPNDRFSCPSCGGGYVFGGKPGQKRDSSIDGKRLRSLEREERTQIEQVKYLPKSGSK